MRHPQQAQNSRSGPHNGVTLSLAQLRSDLERIVRAALDAVDAVLLVRRAMVDPVVAAALNGASAVHVAAAGKAASVMLDACAGCGVSPRAMLGIGPSGSPAPPTGTEWHAGGHPLSPDVKARLEARASLVEWEQRLAVNYLLTSISGGTRILRARTVQAAVDSHSGELQFACPADFVERVHAAIAKGGA
jgi:glycerate-2-kinase